MKEACELFQVRAKQLSQVLTSRKYLTGGDKKGTGPKARGKKSKSIPSAGAMKKAKTGKEKDHNNDDDNNTTHQKVKDRLY